MTDRAHEPLEVTLRRLKEERDEADRRYNEALTALDRSQPSTRLLPDPPPPYDELQITPLNEAWNIIPDAPATGGGLAGRVRGIVWRVVAPYFQRQLTFNSRLVDHVNRNVAGHRDAQRVTEATLARLRDHLASLAHFHAQLIVYLQQITAYVDTKDRDSGSGALVLNAALSAVAKDMAKRWESMTAREQRSEARTATLAATHDELRAMIGVTQHAASSLKRELERMLAGQPAAASQERPAGHHDEREAFGSTLDAYKYVGFEDQFRGSPATIRERLESYVPFFSGATGGLVLDVGCGRGEFLDLLAARGIAARGIDLNHEMAEGCRARGLDVTEADAVSYLTSLPDQSLGGIFAAQVVEHLQPGYLLRFLELAFHKLGPGGRLVLETLNPACWVAFFDSYIRDITHVWPLHPDTLKYLVIASGFSRADIEFRSPVPPQDRLQGVAVPAGADAVLSDFADTFNANIVKLNSRIFTFLDYAVVGTR
jgi:O-antigen chain-terminating methyltransferase